MLERAIVRALTALVNHVLGWTRFTRRSLEGSCGLIQGRHDNAATLPSMRQSRPHALAEAAWTIKGCPGRSRALLPSPASDTPPCCAWLAGRFRRASSALSANTKHRDAPSACVANRHHGRCREKTACAPLLKPQAPQPMSPTSAFRPRWIRDRARGRAAASDAARCEPSRPPPNEAGSRATSASVRA